MEEQKSNSADIDDGSINGLKSGLVGHLSDVGNTIFWGTLRPVPAALGASLALTGNIFGPLLFLFLLNVVRLGFRWIRIEYGYTKGTDIIKIWPEIGFKN